MMKYIKEHKLAIIIALCLLTLILLIAPTIETKLTLHRVLIAKPPL